MIVTTVDGEELRLADGILAETNDSVTEDFYIYLREFKKPRKLKKSENAVDGSRAIRRYAQLRTEMDPDGEGWCVCVLRPRLRMVGCKTFDKQNFDAILKVIKISGRAR